MFVTLRLILDYPGHLWYIGACVRYMSAFSCCISRHLLKVESMGSKAQLTTGDHRGHSSVNRLLLRARNPNTSCLWTKVMSAFSGPESLLPKDVRYFAVCTILDEIFLHWMTMPPILGQTVIIFTKPVIDFTYCREFLNVKCVCVTFCYVHWNWKQCLLHNRQFQWHFKKTNISGHWYHIFSQ